MVKQFPRPPSLRCRHTTTINRRCPHMTNTQQTMPTQPRSAHTSTRQHSTALDSTRQHSTTPKRTKHKRVHITLNKTQAHEYHPTWQRPGQGQGAVQGGGLFWVGGAAWTQSRIATCARASRLKGSSEQIRHNWTKSSAVTSAVRRNTGRRTDTHGGEGAP